MQISMTEAPELIMDTLKAHLVPFIQSSPGVGKSSLAHQIAEKYKLEVIDIRLSQCDPADLNGMPFVSKDAQGHDITSYLPINIWPLEGKPLPKGKEGWLILLDELNSAPLSVQAASYKLILDRMVGMHKLHKRALIMAAGNLSTDKAIVHRMGTAMQSRLIHFTITVDKDAWIKWADANGIDYRVKSFIHFKPQALHNFNPNHQEETFSCPRTWQFVSQLIKPMETFNLDKIPLVAGAIGEGMAREFYSYVKMFGEIPDINSILKDPENVHFGDDPSMHYALSGLISYHLSPKNIDKLMKFIYRLNIDFQVITLKSAIARDINIKDTEPYRQWIYKNSSELM